MSDWNAKIIDEFRANHGRVGPPFEGAPMIIVHHRGRRSGTDYETPLVYLPGEDADSLYIFASKAGAPTHPAWYHNLVSAGQARAEVGDETFDVAVRELTGEERERVFAEQASRMPNFAGYAEKTEGVREIPVLELRRRGGS